MVMQQDQRDWVCLPRFHLLAVTFATSSFLTTLLATVFYYMETLIVILYLRIFLPVFTFIIITSLITRAIRNWSIWTLIDPPHLLTFIVVRFHTDFPLNTRLSSLTRPWNWAVHRGLAKLKRNHRIYDIIIPTALPPLSFR